jgi:hypothetical protein
MIPPSLRFSYTFFFIFLRLSGQRPSSVVRPDWIVEPWLATLSERIVVCALQAFGP